MYREPTPDTHLRWLVTVSLVLLGLALVIAGARDVRGAEIDCAQPRGPMDAYLCGQAGALAETLILPDDLAQGFYGIRPEPMDRHDKAWLKTSLLGLFGFGDLWFTGRAFRLNPDAYERNPWGQSVEERFALKGIVLSGFAVGINALERRGHSYWATVLTVGGCLFYSALMVEAYRIGNEGRDGPR